MKILVVFHSIGGNTLKLARAVAEGAGADAYLKRVEELVPDDVLIKNPSWVKIRDELKKIPIANPKELAEYDAIIFGSPTRYGNMSYQMKHFFDRTGSLWVSGSLVGKVAAFFTTNETLHGGKEATLLSMFPPAMAHGMIIVGLPPTEEKLSKHGSYYGATSTGTPTENDLYLAKQLGKRVAEIAKKLSAR